MKKQTQATDIVRRTCSIVQLAGPIYASSTQKLHKIAVHVLNRIKRVTPDSVSGV